LMRSATSTGAFRWMKANQSGRTAML